jgi:hypothetical protein
MRRLWRWTVRIDLHAPMLGTAKKQKTKVWTCRADRKGLKTSTDTDVEFVA